MSKEKKNNKKSDKPAIIVLNPVHQTLDILQTIVESNKIIAQKLNQDISLLSMDGATDVTVSNCTFIAEQEKENKSQNRITTFNI